MNDIQKKNIKAYDDTIEEYHNKTKDLLEDQGEELQQFCSLVKKGGKVLDLACGPGRDAKFFIEQGFEVVGVDLGEKVIAKAKQVCPKAIFHVMDMCDLKFEDGSFDGIWFNAGLFAIEKKYNAQVLKKIHAILKKDSPLFISVKEGQGEGFMLDKRYNVEKYFALHTKDEIKNLLEQAGFEIINITILKPEGDYATHQWIDVMCRKK